MQMAFLMAALAAAAGPADDPSAFVDGLYAYYAAPDPGPRADADVYTPGITALFAHLAALAGPDEVTRGGDDICQCQDWVDLRVIERTVQPAGEDRAEADIRFENFGRPYRARLLLERTPHGWRVADIAEHHEGQGLAATLRADIAELEQARR